MPVTVSYMASRADMARVWLALLLAAMTVVLFGWYDRFERSGGDIITGFAAPGWQAQGPGGIERGADTLRLSNDDNTATVALHYRLPRPATGSRLRLEVEAHYRDVLRDDYRYANARVFLVQFDASGRPLWHHPHNLLRGHGTQDWQSLNEVFLLGSATSSLRLTASLSRASGTLWLRNLRLYPVAEIAEVSVARVVLLTAWAGYLLWVVGGIARRSGGLPALACVILVAAIVAGVMLPHDTERLINTELEHLAQSAGVEPKVQKSTTTQAPTASTPPRSAKASSAVSGFMWSEVNNVGHLIMFALLTTAVLGLSGAGSIWRRVLMLLAFAAITEVLQLLSLDRYANMRDFLTDVAGITVGLLLVLGWRRWRRGAVARSAD